MSEVLQACERARVASRALAVAHRDVKDRALAAMAAALEAGLDDIVAANGVDVAAARAAGTDPGIIDRLTLDVANGVVTGCTVG